MILHADQAAALLTDPATGTPLTGFVYAATSSRILTVHTSSGCPLARQAPRTFPAAYAAAGDLTGRVLPGCPVCRTTGLVSRLAEGIAEVVDMQDQARERILEMRDDRGPQEYAMARGALVDTWEDFVGNSRLTGLTTRLVARLGGPDSPIGATTAGGWAHALDAWARAWCRTYALDTPELCPPAEGRVPGQLVVVTSTVPLRTDEENVLHRLDPVAVHAADTDLRYAVFAVTAAEADQLRDIAARNRSPVRPGSLSWLRDPWVATVSGRVSDLFSDPDAWRLLVEMLRSSQTPPADVTDMFEAARGALADARQRAVPA